MYQILPSAPGGPASGHFWQIRPNPTLANFLAGFPDLADFRTAAVHVDYFQPKIMKLVMTSQLSDLTV